MYWFSDTASIDQMLLHYYYNFIAILKRGTTQFSILEVTENMKIKLTPICKSCNKNKNLPAALLFKVSGLRNNI